MALPAARLTPPSARRVLVSRPRVTDAMTARGDTPRLVLVSAQAGAGKTTAVAQWLDSVTPDVTVAWLALTPDDADPSTLASEIGEALARARGVEAHAPASDVDGIVAMVEKVGGRVIVVLDDYHLADDPGVNADVERLIDLLPAHATVALTTRVDPPLPLARWRARGELVEVRRDDLAFTHDEARSFLTEIMDLSLSDDHVAALCARTEGWAAGLQLASLTARARRHDPAALDAFVEQFAGSSRFVLDYLVEEVLRGLPKDVREFLFDVSILTTVTASLAEVVSRVPDGQAMLERLESANLFLVSLDDERRWFRLHQLFADALHAQALAEDPDRVARTHRDAARWYAGEGYVVDAVPHAFEAGDHDFAAAMLELAMPALKSARRDHSVVAWLERLPAEVVAGVPVLAAYAAWSHLAQGDVARAAAALDGLEDARVQVADPAQRWGLERTPALDDAVRALDHERAQVPATVASYRAVVAQAVGDIAATREHAARALELAPEGDHYARGAAGGLLALAQWALGEVDEAIATFRAAIEDLRSGGSPANAIASAVVLGSMWLTRGDLDAARRVYEAALAESGRTGAGSTVEADLHVGLAEVAHARDDLDAARSHLAAADALGDAASLPENRFRRTLVRARIAASDGDLDAAIDLFAAADAARLPGFMPEVLPVSAERARALAEAGRLREAREWLDAANPPAPGEGVAFVDAYAAATRELIEAAEAGSPGPSPSVASSPGAAPASAAGGFVEPLSDREADVLRLLASDLSGPEIARELFISLNTFRTHTKAIYLKLDVGTRRAAVTRARELGLI